MITIAVTSVGSGIGNAVLHALRSSGIPHRTIGFDSSPRNSAILSVDRAHLVPPIAAGAGYVERVLSLCVAERVDLLIPGLDTELGLIAESRASFETAGCQVVVSAPAVVSITLDKLETYRWCSARDLPFARTLTLAEAIESAGSLEYPVIVKQRSGSGSVGARLVLDDAELRAPAAPGEWVVQGYLPPRDVDLQEQPRSTTGLDQSHEVSAQFFVTSSGSIAGEFLSLNRLKHGVPIEIVPLQLERPAMEGRAIVRALAAEGARGPINLQGRLTAAGGVEFFEINARYTGITGVRALMGYHEVVASIHDLLGDDEALVREAIEWQVGSIGFRQMTDTIHSIARVNDFEDSPDPGIPGAGVARKVLVTGATGYIGSSLLALLDTDPRVATVMPLARPGSGARKRSAHVVVGDLLEGELDLSGFDTVIHLAADRGLSGDAVGLYGTNVEGTRRLVVAAREAGVGRFVYLSSQAVYGTRRQPLWPEWLPPQPETAYGTSKWMGELACRPEHAGSMRVVCLRAARAYGVGERMRWDELPHRFADFAVRGLPLPVIGDGRQRMDFVHVNDVARAVALAMHADVPPGHTVLNVGGGAPISINELVDRYDTAARRLDLPAVTRSRGDAPVVPPPDFGMDARRARSVLGWVPQISIETGVAELLAAARDRHANAG